jgi:hypothetical protein
VILGFFDVVAADDCCLLWYSTSHTPQSPVGANGDVVVTANQRVGKTMLQKVGFELVRGITAQIKEIV